MTKSSLLEKHSIPHAELESWMQGGLGRCHKLWIRKGWKCSEGGKGTDNWGQQADCTAVLATRPSWSISGPSSSRCCTATEAEDIGQVGIWIAVACPELGTEQLLNARSQPSPALWFCCWWLPPERGIKLGTGGGGGETFKWHLENSQARRQGWVQHAFTCSVERGSQVKGVCGFVLLSRECAVPVPNQHACTVGSFSTEEA